MSKTKRLEPTDEDLKDLDLEDGDDIQQAEDDTLPDEEEEDDAL